MTDEEMYRYRNTIENILTKEWRNPRSGDCFLQYPLRLSEEDIFDPAVTVQNIKKMAKRIAMFEELDYDK